MTLNAQVVDGFVVDEVLVLGPVRAVAAQAVQGQVPVARIDHFAADGVRGVGLPVVALAAQVDGLGLGENEAVVGAVHRMAGAALTVGDGLMLGLAALLAGNSVCMAAAAHVEHGAGHQIGFRRGVGGMTVDAAFFVGQGPVQTVFVEGVVEHLVVAALAELISRFQGSEGGRRGGIFVALLAHPLLQGLVHVVVENGLAV